VTTSKGRASTFAVYGWPLLLVAAVGTTAQSLASGWRDQFPDFAIFYSAALALRQGTDPYTSLRALGLGPNTNPPAVVLALEPLTWLPFSVAALLWLLLGTVILLMTVTAITRKVPSSSGVLLLLIVLTTQACALTIRQGQLVFFILALFTIAWRADADRHPWVCGVTLGILMSLKPFYGVFAVYFLWRRDWRTVAGIVLGGTASAVFGLLAGAGAYRSWLTTLASVNWHADLTNVSIWGLAARLFAMPPQEPYIVTTTPMFVSGVVVWCVRIFGMAAIVGLTAWFLNRRPSVDRVWAVLSLAALLLSPLAWVYYVIVGIGPIAATIARARAWKVAWIGGAALSVPFALVQATHGGAFGTLTMGSIYSIATLGLWAALIAIPCSPSSPTA
jgi:alpha-1,2-mannosyltransferase